MAELVVRWGGRGKRAVRRILHPFPESEGKLAADAGAYWKESAEDAGKRDLSHWLGEGRWRNEDAWLSIGRSHFELFQMLRRMAGRDQPLNSMVEWGPGGGANAVAFSGIVPIFYGIDISSPNLEECGRQLARIGYRGFRACPIEADRPESAIEAVTPPVDFFLCTAVYQHFPGRDYGVRVTRVAHRLLARDGLALIQVRYDDGSAVYRSRDRDYRANAVTFTSFSLEQFWRLVQEIGFRPLGIHLQPASNYAYYFLSKGKL